MKNYITHYAFRNIINKNKTFFSEILFNNISSLKGLMNRIDAIAVNPDMRNTLGYVVSTTGFKTEDEATNKLKGDLFEIFVEILIKLDVFGNELRIAEYRNTTKDAAGVDAIGVMMDKNVTIQIKFLSDPRNVTEFTKIATFVAISPNYGATPNTQNFILITTSYDGVDVLSNQLFGNSLRIIDNSKISKYIDGLTNVWNDILALFDRTILDRDKLQEQITSKEEKEKEVIFQISNLKNDPTPDSPIKYYHPMMVNEEGIKVRNTTIRLTNYSQKECYEKLQQSDRLSVILPTGCGKGHLLFVDLLSRIYYNKGEVFVIASHRIGLNKQHTDDMFKNFAKFTGDIGYVFVSCEKYDENRLTEIEGDFKKVSSELMGLNINPDELITTLKDQSLSDIIEEHRRNRRKVVIITTYHSLQKLHNVPLDVIYCDEADKLVSNKSKPASQDNQEENFMKKFLNLTVKKSYFFTATPKDWSLPWYGQQNIQFMNNTAIFGERIGMEFDAAVKLGYILRPYLHIVFPNDYIPEDIEITDEEDLEEGDNQEIDFREMNINIPAKILLINEAFETHKKFLKERSADPDKIGAKLLIKCKNISSDMWGIFHDGLQTTMPNIKIFAGGSYGYPYSQNEEQKLNNHYMYSPTEKRAIPIKNRDEYLKLIKGLSLEEDAIVLHCDILSEGINVEGFTAVMFVNGVTLTDSKILQNIGRATRLLKHDREALKNGIISTEDLSKWVKPFCNVIIPFWNSDSLDAKDKMVEIIRNLRESGFELEKFSTGTELNVEDIPEDPYEPINTPVASKRKSGIKDLIHDIEEIEYLSRLYNMRIENPMGFFNEINDINKDLNEVDQLFDDMLKTDYETNT